MTFAHPLDTCTSADGYKEVIEPRTPRILQPGGNSTMTFVRTLDTYVEATAFQADVDYLEALFQRQVVGDWELPLIDTGQGAPLVFVPILEHLEFVYARQVRFFSQQRRVILYRRHETRMHYTSIQQRVEELRELLNHLEITSTDFIAHGDGAMVLLEFALRYPQRCRSLTIIAQGAEYQIKPHPWIWLLHELYLRLPVERILPASFVRRTVVNYIVSRQKGPEEQQKSEPVHILQRDLIESQFSKINSWPSVYKFSVLPVIHRFDIRKRLKGLTMPILLINRFDDALSPEHKTHWLAEHLPNCAGYHVIPGGERFFMYSEAARVNQIIQGFLEQGETV